MSVTINFYNMSDDNLVVNKTLTSIASYDCEITDECDISSPRFVITKNDTLLPANYAYISKYNRYYFVNINILNGNEMEFNLSVDRLMSFVNPNKANLTGYVERNEQRFNTNIVDEQGIFTNDRDIKTVAITSNGLTKPIENWKLIGVFNAGLCETIEEVTP